MKIHQPILYVFGLMAVVFLLILLPIALGWVVLPVVLLIWPIAALYNAWTETSQLPKKKYPQK